jgi:Skp family chaperone for outer membrane proteins
MSRWILYFGLAALLALGAGNALAQNESIKIGVFDPESLWKQTEVGKRYNQDLGEIRDRLQADIDKKLEEMESLKSKLRQQQSSLNDEKIQQMQKDILGKKTEYDRLNEDATKEMKFKLGDVQGRFQEMLLVTLDAFGKEKGYALVLNKGVTDYSAASIDVTPDLIAKFNEMHKAPPASAAKSAPKKAPDKPKEPAKN